MRVDAHAHFYPEFDPGVFLTAAQRNLRSHPDRGSSAEGPADRCIGLLFVSDTGRAGGFRDLRDAVRSGAATGWTAVETGEPLAFSVEAARAGRLTIGAATQLTTSDGLEVIGLGLNHAVERRPLHDTIAAVAEAGAVPVIPWGAGKWWGRRRRLLERLLDDPPVGLRFHVGDSGLRPTLAQGALFAVAAARGVLDLPGSDPLPLAAHARRPGSCGFEIPGELADAPFHSTLDHLRSLRVQPVRYGRHCGPVRFAIDQAALRLRPHG